MSSKKVQIFKPYLAMVKKIGETIGVPRMRQSEVAKELGVTTAGISDMSKKDYIPADTMLRWAKRRKVSVDWILSNAEQGMNISSANNQSEEVEMLKDDLITQMKKFQVLSDKHTAVLEENAALREEIASSKRLPLTKKKSG